MNFFLSKLKLLYKLGVVNVIRNLRHKKNIQSGRFKKQSPISARSNKSQLQLFNVDESHYQHLDNSFLLAEFKYDFQELLQGNVKLFFRDYTYIGNPPSWFFHNYKSVEQHWSEVKLNEKAGEDVKLTWDLSRFHWMQQLACGYQAYGSNESLELINSWFSEWVSANPTNSGVNWSCGQECSIRIIHILNTTKIIKCVPYNKKLLALLVESYARRVKLTIDYAVSQDNNHGVTEAAALFICGAWLLKNTTLPEPFSKSIISVGRKILEDRVAKLIMPDGGFSMYSTNYHRVVLNTLSIVEMWRQELKQPEFTEQYTKNCKSAISWLYLLVDEVSGDLINLGTNDGSNPFIVQSSDYRDYRPSVQFASTLILNHKAYESSDVTDEPLSWLGINQDLPVKNPCVVESKILKDSGIVVLFGSDIGVAGTKVLVKYPNYKFRPGQSDALHVDLWHKKRNILRDAGSYSYNGMLDEDKYFSSLQAHNTVQVDSIEPMTKVGPFLRSNWSKMSHVGEIERKKNSLSWRGEYNIKQKVTHSRIVTLSDNRLSIRDDVSGADKVITLRWRLDSSSWELNENILLGEGVRIKISSSERIGINLKSGFESRYYNHYEDVPVLEVSVNAKFAHITTDVYLE